jgi:hypothetical protein
MPGDFSEFKMSFIDVLEALCKRPKMYTENGTFGEVWAYLDGYAKGKGLAGNYHSFFSPFSEWLRATYPEDSKERQTVNDRSNHNEALTEFARLCREYEMTVTTSKDR